MSWLLLALAPVLAGAPEPALLAGSDIVAWRSVLENPSPAATLAYLESWPESPLAELALRRWLESDEGRRADPRDQPARESLSLRHHEAALGRSVIYQGVVRLEPEIVP